MVGASAAPVGLGADVEPGVVGRGGAEIERGAGVEFDGREGMGCGVAGEEGQSEEGEGC